MRKSIVALTDAPMFLPTMITVVGSPGLLRSPPCIKPLANFGIAEQSFVKPNFHQKIHCFADGATWCDAQMLHHGRAV
jgi:hypothetical protein